MKCKKCKKESNSLVQSGREGNIEWEDLGLCPKCWSEYRKEKGIKSLREIDNELRLNHTQEIERRKK